MNLITKKMTLPTSIVLMTVCQPGSFVTYLPAVFLWFKFGPHLKNFKTLFDIFTPPPSPTGGKSIF